MVNLENLKPVYASSNMHITRKKDRIHFLNIITFDYQDVKGQQESESYFSYIEDANNYDEEVNNFWENMQNFLDEEINKVNGEEINLSITHCCLHFRQKIQPYVQYTIEFDGPLISGVNFYENYIENERLEYPIYSIYFLKPHFKVTNIKTSLDYIIHSNKQVVEYFGEKGQNVGTYESIQFVLDESDDI